MNFKEKYKQEIGNIKHEVMLDAKILQEVGREPISFVAKRRRFTSVAVAAAIALVIMVANFETVSVFATSLIGNFGLILGGKEAVLNEIELVDLDYERYSNDTKAEWNGANYYYNYEDFHEGLGMTLPANDTFVYQSIMVHLVEGDKSGTIGATFSYGDENFHMNGRFLVSEYGNHSIGYGEEGRAYYEYEYAEGKKAYFVRDWGNETYQRVYFSTNHYVFQLFVENSNEGAQNAKEILDIIGKEF